jgi:CheY-like chemotaxis protein
MSRILIVDDDEAIRRLSRRILEGDGYHVLTAANGPAALAAVGLAMLEPGSAIHLVLTDVDMPRMDGYTLGRRLALRWPALPVVYMSGTTHGLAGRASLSPWEHFIAKPFSAGDLLPKVDLALRLAAGAADDPRGEGGGGSPPLTRETIAAASDAGAAVAYLGEDARWALLQKWLEQEPASQRKAGRRSSRLEALRSIVSPRVTDREWDRVVQEHRRVRWADELRLANALATSRSTSGLHGDT